MEHHNSEKQKCHSSLHENLKKLETSRSSSINYMVINLVFNYTRKTFNLVMVIIKQLTIFIKFLIDICESKIAKAKIRVEKGNIKYLGYIRWVDMLKNF